MRTIVNIIPNRSNTVSLTEETNKVVVTDNSQNTSVEVTQPTTTVIEVVTGPQGKKGDRGDAVSSSFSFDSGSFTTTSSFNSFTSSYYQDSASFSGSIGNLTTATSSYVLNSQTSSFVSNNQTGSFAITGSNIFRSDQTISGSLFISDRLKVNDSVGFGIEVTASGVHSFAHGDNTTASGYGAHAEGSYTFAVGENSHAEGLLCESRGGSSHAEGQETIAKGYYSHAEGKETISHGINSHAEGHETLASGSYSHAEGKSTAAYGEGSHAEGLLTIASGSYSHAQGYETQALGKGSFAGGIGTVADNDSQTAIGSYNVAGDPSAVFVVGTGKNGAPQDGFSVRVDVDQISSITIPSSKDLPSNPIVGTLFLNPTDQVLYIYLGVLVGWKTIKIL